MKILYMAALDLNDSRYLGVFKKVAAMSKAFAEAGNQVFYCVHDDNYTLIRYITTEKELDVFRGYMISPRSDFYRHALKWAVKNGIEILYIRFNHLDSISVHFLKLFHKMGIRIILELPTFPYSNERDRRHQVLLEQKKYIPYVIKRLAILEEDLHIRYAHKYIDQIVTFTYDGRIWNIPSLRIDNGIDCSQVRLRTHTQLDNRCRFIYIANFAPWHALDRFIQGLRIYQDAGNNLEHLELWVIGSGSQIPVLKELVHNYSLEQTVKFLGPKHGQELECWIDKADIGIGSLGLHRIGLQTGSTLKTKEYCACGLPFIYASPEYGLNGQEQYALLLPSDESPIDIARVLAFKKKVYETPDIACIMRRKAETDFSWVTLVKRILDEGAYR